MPIRSPRILKLVLATTALLAFPTTAHALSQAPPKPVVDDPGWYTYPPGTVAHKL